MQMKIKRRRGIALAILICIVGSAFLAVPSARACLSDAVGLVLNFGELPGGG